MPGVEESAAAEGAGGCGGRSGVSLLLMECLLSSVTSDKGDRGSADWERCSDDSGEDVMASVTFGLATESMENVQQARKSIFYTENTSS